MKHFTGEGEKGRLEESADGIDCLAESVIGAAIAVHRALGPGLPESVYGKALAVELTALSIPFRTEVSSDIWYREIVVGTGRADLIIDDRLIVELKAIESLLPVHSAQVISYLSMFHLPAGLLINFHVAKLANGIRRLNHPKLHHSRKAVR